MTTTPPPQQGLLFPADGEPPKPKRAPISADQARQAEQERRELAARTTPGHWVAQHGAQGILEESEVAQLAEGAARVWSLMKDGAWYDADQIELAAGNGAPAREGLRRMRDLRPTLERVGLVIEKQRVKAAQRLFQYRITQKPQANQ